MASGSPVGASPWTRFVAPDVAEVERALLALAPAERAAVIRAGLLSLGRGNVEVSQDEIDAAWRAEVGERLDDVLESRVQLGSFEATRAGFTAAFPLQSDR